MQGATSDSSKETRETKTFTQDEIAALMKDSGFTPLEADRRPQQEATDGADGAAGGSDKKGNPVKKRAPLAKLHSDADPSHLHPPGQNYCVMSVAGPGCRQRADSLCAKFRGCFETREAAAGHITDLQRDDAVFDIFIVRMYEWLPLPLSASMTTDDARAHVDTLIGQYTDELNRDRGVHVEGGEEDSSNGTSPSPSPKPNADNNNTGVGTIGNNTDTRRAERVGAGSNAADDRCTVDGQSLVLVSVVQVDAGRMVKIHGAFADEKECKNHVGLLRSADKCAQAFDTYTLSQYIWSSFDVPSSTKKEYDDPELQEIMDHFHKEKQYTCKV